MQGGCVTVVYATVDGDVFGRFLGCFDQDDGRAPLLPSRTNGSPASSSGMCDASSTIGTFKCCLTKANCIATKVVSSWKTRDVRQDTLLALLLSADDLQRQQRLRSRDVPRAPNRGRSIHPPDPTPSSLSVAQSRASSTVRPACRKPACAPCNSRAPHRSPQTPA